MGTCEIKQLSPELPKSPSADDYRVSTALESGSSPSTASGSGSSTLGSPTEKPGESK
jgi:hypothetical protein